MSKAKSTQSRKKKSPSQGNQGRSVGIAPVFPVQKDAATAKLLQLESRILLRSTEEAIAALAAIAAVPAEKMVWISRLARFCTEHGQVEKGASLVAWGLKFVPDDPHLLIAAGLVQAKAGNAQFAVECYEAVLSKDPTNVEALSHLSDLLISLNQWSAALPFLLTLKELRPDNTTVYRFLGNCYIKISRPDEAVSIFRRCLQLDPSCMETKIGLGISLRMIRCYDEAESFFLEVASAFPENPDVNNSLAWLYSDVSDFDKALYYAEKACALQPTNISYLYCHGFLLRRFGKRKEARVIFERALRLNPNDLYARFGYAELILADGELQKGLAYYESRFEVSQIWLSGPWPLWDGKVAAGHNILVRHEQGVGDTLQFCRYLIMLQQQGAEVFFSCQPPIADLMHTLPGITVIPAGNDEELAARLSDTPIHGQIALLSLMGVFKTTLETIPHQCPYLSVSPQLVAAAKQRFAPTNKLKVALVWAGNPNHANDHNRSIVLDQFEPLHDLQDEVAFYSLQMGEARRQLNAAGRTLKLHDLSPGIKNYSDTAALMTLMDIIVSVDTSPAHLAGALGLPVVTLIPFASDWRWLLERSDSPWYPSMHLLRQPVPCDWATVMIELKEYLRARIFNRGAHQEIIQP